LQFSSASLDIFQIYRRFEILRRIYHVVNPRESFSLWTNFLTHNSFFENLVVVELLEQIPAFYRPWSLKHSLLCDITRHRLVAGYRRFGTCCRSHIQRPSSSRRANASTTRHRKPDISHNLKFNYGWLSVSYRLVVE
jgi:hypothetical protein